MANLGSLTTNFFPSSQEGFTTTLAVAASYGATTISIAGSGTYTNGQIIVLVLEPGTATFNVVTGALNTSTTPITVTNCVWTEGGNHSHALGAAVADYVSATHLSMMTKGFLAQHNQSGGHTAVTSTSIVNSGSINTGSLSNSGAYTGTMNYANLLSTIFSGQVLSQANAGTAGGTMYYVNLGGIKLLWGFTTTLTSSGSPSQYVITYPTGFFTSVQYVGGNLAEENTTQEQYISFQRHNATDYCNINFWNGGQCIGSFLVIGT